MHNPDQAPHAAGERQPESAIPEPPEHTFLCWFDTNGDPYAVFYRTDQHLEDSDDPDRWFNASVYGGANDEPMTWPEVLAEMKGFRGPVELISNGELATR